MIAKSPPSNRHFGFLFCGIFILLSAFFWYAGESLIVIYGLLIIALVNGLVSIMAPDLLTPFNHAWMKLGELMGKVVSPIVLGIIFFTLLTPTGLIGRFFGRDELRLRKTKTGSYWIDRVPPGPSGDSFKNQF